MLIRAVRESLVNLGEDEDNLVLLVRRHYVVVNQPVVKLPQPVSRQANEQERETGGTNLDHRL